MPRKITLLNRITPHQVVTAETRDFFLDGQEDMAQSFARTLRGLLMVTVEKVGNAVVGVIWKAISTATGLALTVPRH
jgi:hypothetical protein